MTTRPMRLLLAASGVLLLSDATADDRFIWQEQVEVETVSSDFQVLPDSEGGFRLFDGGWLARYDSASELRSIERMPLSPRGVARPQDGLVFFEPFQDVISQPPPLSQLCSFARLQEGASLRRLSYWLTWNNQPVAPGGAPRPAPLLDAEGGFFASVFDGLVRIGPDCVAEELDPGINGRVWNIPNAVAAFVAAGDKLARIDTRLIEWEVELGREDGGAPGDVVVEQVFVQDSGDALVVGTADGASAEVHLARVSAAGELLWEARVDAENILHMQAIGSATVAVARSAATESAAAEDRTIAFDESGAKVAEVSLAPLFFGAPAIRPDDYEGTPPWLLSENPGGWPTDAVVTPRADAEVDLIATVPDSVAAYWVLTDGRVLGIDRADAEQPRVVLLSGSEIEPLSAQLPGAAGQRGMFADADGVAFVAIADDAEASLHHVGVDGSLDWSLPLQSPGYDPQMEAVWLLSASAATVCVAHGAVPPAGASLQCVDRDTGAPTLGPLDLGTDSIELLQAADDGGAALYTQLPFHIQASGCAEPPCPRPLTRLQFAAGSTTPEQSEVAAGQVFQMRPIANGATLALGSFDEESRASVLALAADGSTAWSLLLPESWGTNAYMALSADQGMLLTAAVVADGRLELQAVDPADGSSMWSIELEAGSLSEPYLTMAAVSGAWVLSVDGGSGAADHSFAISSEGVVLWDAEGELASRVVAGAGAGVDDEPVFALLQHQRPAADVELRAIASNEVVEALTVSGSSPDVTARGTSDGRMYALETLGEGPVSGLGLRAFDLPALLAVADADVGQPALRGHWYRPDTTGQGLFLDYFPKEDVIHGAWFTFSAEGGEAVSEQRWYALHGPAPAGTAPAMLEILQVGTGQQQAPPGADTTVIGTAELWLDDCGHARLAYRFDDPIESPDGLVPLQRLARPSLDCVAENAEEAAVPTSAAARGGTWYNPATSGEGMFLEPVTAGADMIRLAVIWTRLDDADLAADGAARQWLTLLSDPAAADADSFSFDILRTIGGRFDREPTDNTQVIGSASLVYANCAEATLSYAFDPNLPGPFAGQSGEVTMQRIGVCSDQR